jgi:AhpD family alkylhydroperoxidase
MTSQEQNLSAAQTELVAVGASVGTGCQPCLSRHLQVGAQAGLEGEQLLAAVASAERVGAEAAVAIGDHARATLGASVASPALLSRLEETLASFGAALGANDAANIERQLRAAADLGASRSQLQKAIDTAHNVQENATRIHLREAERLLEAVAVRAATAATTDAREGEGCGCGADDETQEAPVAAEEPETLTIASCDESGESCGCGAVDGETREVPVTAEKPVAVEGGQAAGRSGTASQIAAREASVAMAGCREMFERFMSFPSPAETDKARAATTAAGACNKEA